MNKFYFKDIKNYLLKHSVNIISKLDRNVIFEAISTLQDANENDLTFFHNTKYLNDLNNTKARACFIEDKYTKYLNKTCIPIIVADPHLAYALVTNYILPTLQSNGIIDSTSIIDKNSALEGNVQINFNSVIKENCKIGFNSVVYENTIIGPNVIIGANTLIMGNCVISDSIIGKNCIIQSGSIIGGKGFGFTLNRKIEVKHIGNVIIGDYVDIGSNTTIDKGSLNSTIIGDYCKIDNLVQIAHNVKIGKSTIIASQSGIAGSTKIGDHCLIGGQVGIGGHLNIGNQVKIAGKSGVTKNINDNATIAGFPAQDIKKWKKSIINQYKDIK